MAEAQTGANAPVNAAKSVPENFASLFRTQSNPNPAPAAHSKAFSATGRIPFPIRGAFAATIPAFQSFAARNQPRRSQTTASLADNLPVWFATTKI